VTGTQHSSRANVYVGRRSYSKGFEFAGSIEDVCIYSFALTKPEIAAGMRGRVIDGLAVQRATGRGANSNRGAGRAGDLDAPCTVSSEPEDAKIPGAAATFGVLVAVACVGLWPSAGSLLYLVVSFVAGLLLLPVMASSLPPFNLWMMPLVSLAGSASVVASIRRGNV
jgi:hypothetical protein